MRVHFIQPLKERIVREVGYGLSLAGWRRAQPCDPSMHNVCKPHSFAMRQPVLTSESTLPEISFRDSRSGKAFAGKLQRGRAALLLVSDNGELLASYNW